MEINEHEGGKYIRHFIDKHPLILMEEEAVECVLCHEKIHGPTYGCTSCKFYIHKSCGDLEQGFPRHGITLQHSSHQHPLTLLLLRFGNCRICKKRIHGPRYGCDLCLCYIHKSCAELQQKMLHPLHPAHFLTLGKYGSHVCDACRFDAEGFYYRCATCEFCLHLGCLYVKPNIKYEGHDHLLVLVENISDESQCDACDLKITGTFFLRCVQCSLNFHVQCDTHQLPQTIAHNLHQHPLAFVNETPVKDDCDLLHCAACREEIDPKNPFYFCVECDYFVHVRCVVTEVKFDKKIRHFSHQHLLILTEKIDDISCCACKKGIQGTAYGCGSCSVYLHESCVKLPRKTRHPSDQHFLTLQKPVHENVCDACQQRCYGFTYRCEHCDFDLDLDCVIPQPSIEYEGHEHILTFFKKLDYAPECIACYVTLPEAPYLCCARCNFYIHLTCSPLPRTLEHWSHPPHPLALHNRYIDDNYDMQICDVCETKRDFRECVYYCAECDFIAEFDCVISEVIHCLERERGDVQLKTVNRDKGDRERLTLGAIFGSCTEEESQKMEDIKQKLGEYIDKMSEGGIGTGSEANIVGISENLVHSEATFAHYMARLIKNSQEKPSTEDFIDMEDEVINDGDYMITWKLARVLKKLLDKYKDFTSNCTFTTENPKTILLAGFCRAVQSMSRTKIKDVTDLLICKWWCQFKFVQLAGFKIDFALNHLRETENARRRSKIQTYRNTPLYRLNKEMAEVSGKIDEQSQEIDKLEAKMEGIRSEKRDVISSYRSEASRSEAKRLDEALELLIKYAGTGLLE